jgi:hypothetical protein
MKDEWLTHAKIESQFPYEGALVVKPKLTRD